MSIKIENLTHVYMPGSPFERKALDDINLSINDGEFIALIGHTGSGKSTLIQHLNGLLKPNKGKIIVNGTDITEKKIKLNNIRKEIGLVFQYPEYQLFEETVEKDIAFGPKNLGISDEEILIRVKKSMQLVGLDYDEYRYKSPFELSGGQKRKVAIAGVIAMEPKVLILDEPTAGLDPRAREELLNTISELHIQSKNTIILVSHNMEDVAKVASRIIVMKKGKCILDDVPQNVFKQVEVLEEAGLAVPQIAYLASKLKQKGFDITKDIYTIEEAKNELQRLLRGVKND